MVVLRLNMFIRSFTLIILISGLSFSCSRSTPEMILVEGGTFTMGNNNGEPDEQPAHSVTLSSFKIGKYEVTMAQYKAFCQATDRQMGEAPPWGWNDKYPMVYITFDDANAYCNWLSSKEVVKYRLPTEAEWEYAARGGNKSKGYTYSGSNDPDEPCWNYDNSGEEPHATGLKTPNELGIYDMSGNIWEWCMDWYSEYSGTAQTDPQGHSTGQTRVLRGGCYGYPASDSRVARRYGSDPSFSGSPYHGFRVVCSL
jgi:sulfatase modifying factor 1